MGVLTVFLEKCSNLKDEDGAMNGSDTYVVMTVEKDRFGPINEGLGKETSTTKQGDQSPVFEETFTFEDIPNDLENIQMKIKVMDSDVGLDDKLGSCTIQLAELGLSADPTDVERVVDNNLIRKDGKIFLKISFEES